jgi:nucleotidyltransferase substrate binding protein (TIGR01987 family)
MNDKNSKDIRWIQRLDNFHSAFSQLLSAVELSKTRALSDLEKQGTIQAFEFTHELAWNVLKDYFEYQGNSSITGSRDATREAFQKGLLSDGEVWMEMIKSRNQTSHTYNKTVADEIVTKILNEYSNAFHEFQSKMQTLKKS